MCFGIVFERCLDHGSCIRWRRCDRRRQQRYRAVDRLRERARQPRRRKREQKNHRSDGGCEKCGSRDPQHPRRGGTCREVPIVIRHRESRVIERWPTSTILFGIAAALLLLVMIASPLRWIQFIVAQAPNVPFTDEWTWVDILARSRSDGVPWSLLWQPYNGHRIVVPPLFFLFLDRYRGWSIPREELLNVALGVLALWAIFETALRKFGLQRALVAAAVSSIFLLGWSSFETILIGFNVGWQLCSAAFVSAILLLSGNEVRTRHILIVAAFAGVATFSTGQGLLLWPAILVLLLVEPQIAISFSGAAFQVSQSPPTSLAMSTRLKRDLMCSRHLPLGWRFSALRWAGTVI